MKFTNTYRYDVVTPVADECVFTLRVWSLENRDRFISILKQYTPVRFSNVKNKYFCKQYDICIPSHIENGRLFIFIIASVEGLQFLQKVVEEYTGKRGFLLAASNMLNLQSVEIAFDIPVINGEVDGIDDEAEIDALIITKRLAYRILPIRQSFLFTKYVGGKHQFRNKKAFENGILTAYVHSRKRNDRFITRSEANRNKTASIDTKLYCKNFYLDEGWIVRLEATLKNRKLKREINFDWNDFPSLITEAQKHRTRNYWKFVIVDYESFLKEYAGKITSSASIAKEIELSASYPAADQVRIMREALRIYGHKEPAKIANRYIKEISFSEAINTKVPSYAELEFLESYNAQKTNIELLEDLKEKIRITRPRKDKSEKAVQGTLIY